MDLFKHAHCPFVLGTGWGQILKYYRAFDRDQCEQLMGRPTCDRDELKYFAHTACTHRMIIAHITSHMGCDYLGIDYSYVIKQTHTGGLLTPHYNKSRCGHCFIILIGIYDTDVGVWFERGSRGTRGGVQVYNNISGDADEDPLMIPTSFNILH